MNPSWRALFVPNMPTSQRLMVGSMLFWILFLLGLWIVQPFAILPTPMEILPAWKTLWDQGLAVHLFTSVKLNVEATLISTAISMFLAYCTVLPFARPLANFVSGIRFLGLTGITIIFTLMLGGGHELKLWLLVFGMTVFMVTTMIRIVADLASEEYDHAYTLRMGRWEAVYEVLILGQRDKLIEAVLQNLAIGWMMLTMVEGLSRSEGGLGVLLLDQNKHFNLAQLFAIQLSILGLGLLSDIMLRWFKFKVASYAALEMRGR